MINFYNGYSSFTRQTDQHCSTMLEHSYTILELVTPKTGPVLTPPVSYEHPW